VRGRGLRVGTVVATTLLAVIGADGCRAQGVATPLSASTSAPARGSSTVASGSASGVRPVGIPGSWRLVFDDEFGGSKLDTTRWSTGWLAAGITPGVSDLEEDCDDPAQVAVADGTLELGIAQTYEYCAGKTQPYAVGAVNSEGKASFLFGAFEARIYLPRVKGAFIADWPTWWTDGENWPVDGEMDIMEGLSGNACYHLRYSATHADGLCVDGSFAGWHTYAADWEPGSVTYYYDGVEVGQITNSGITPAAQFLVLSYSVHRDSNFTAAPSTMRVDYVRVWQH
jgi:beta-glucanase (GH16 family)